MYILQTNRGQSVWTHEGLTDLNSEGVKMNIDELNLTDDQKEAVTKLIQSETDRVRTDYVRKLKDVENEVQKYKPVEKSEAEKALEARIAALESKEAELSAREQKMALQGKLKARGLDPNLATYLNLGENEEESLNQISSYFLGTSTVPTGHTESKGITKKEFSQMDYNQRMKIFQENPVLYKSLSE